MNNYDDIIEFCSGLIKTGLSMDNIKLYVPSSIYLYPNSINELDGSLLFMIKKDKQKYLLILGAGEVYNSFYGDELIPDAAKLCLPSNENGKALRGLFKFTAPKSHKQCNMTIGLGDRLGLASQGHLRLLRNKPVFPVIAQQSIRELKLTGRTYEDVLNAAAWAVFQEGYKDGYGADGDHLKTEAEVEMALKLGFTMITLDCSDHIDNSIPSLSDSEIDSKYYNISTDIRERYEDEYIKKGCFKIKDNFILEFDYKKLKRIALIYRKAVAFAISLYDKLLAALGDSVDFELSIDETLTETSPEAHFFVASELLSAGVKITSLAPRFYGEFQKGIDYIGDINLFEKQFAWHAAIADHFGYKLSIHSGSDKFAVMPIIGRLTNGRLHLKTAGTNWLEAIKLVALKDPQLFREMFRYALESFEEARRYYHVSTSPDKIPNLNDVSDCNLNKMLYSDNPDARQVIHITYGLILQAKNTDGSYRFKNRLYSLLNHYEDEYCELLKQHIGKHLTCLGVH